MLFTRLASGKLFVLLCLMIGFGCGVTHAQQIRLPDSLMLELAKYPDPDTNRMRELLELAYATERGEPDRSVVFGLEALDIAEELVDSVNILRASMELGNAYNLLGSIPKQRQYYIRALEIARKLDNQSMIADALNNMGTVSLNEMNFDLAKRYFDQSMAIRVELGENKGMLAAYNNLGNVYMGKQVIDSALYFYQKALGEVRTTPNPYAESIILANIGSAYADDHQFRKALAIFREMIPIKLDLKDGYGYAQVYYNIGTTFGDSGVYDSAVLYLERSLVLADSVNVEDLRSVTLRDLSTVFSRLGDYKRAYAYAEQTIEALDTLRKQEADGIADVTELRFRAEQEGREREFKAQKKALEQDGLIARQRVATWITLLVLGLILVIMFFLWRRYRERRKTADMLESRVQKRTAELSDTNERLQAAIAETEASRQDLHTFIYRSSHDLKSPLTSIKGLIDITRLTLEGQEAARYVDLIADRTEHLDGLLGRLIEQVNLLDRAPGLEQVSLQEVWQEARDSLVDVAGFSAMQFSFEGNTSAQIHTDREYLRVILRTLLRNCIDFRELESSENHCVLHAEEQAQGWLLRLTDEGIGMEAEVVENAFEMFYRGSLQAKGSGMGLYTVSKLLQILGGKAWLESEAGKGTTVFVELPRQVPK